MMKTETIYSRLYGYLTQQEGIKNLDILLDGYSSRDPDSHLPCAELVELTAVLRQDLRDIKNRTAGMADVARGCKSIIKAAIKHTPNRCLHGAYIAADGRMCVCSSHHMVVLNQTIELPMAPEPGGFDPKNIIRHKEVCSIPLDLPSIQTLKAHIKLFVAEGKTLSKQCRVAWDFGPSMPYVNAEYLLDMLLALPGALAYWSGKKHQYLYFTGDAGEGVLGPLKRPLQEAST